MSQNKTMQNCQKIKKSTMSTSFQMFLKENKSKMMTNYPFLSHSQIISRLKLQWKKLNTKKTTYKKTHAISKCKLLFKNCNEKDLISLTDNVSVKNWQQHLFDMHNFNLFNDEWEIPSLNNHDHSVPIHSDTSKIINSGTNNKNNSITTTTSQVSAISMNKKNPATICSLDNSSRNIKTYSNHAFQVRHRVPEVYMEKFNLNRVGILKSPKSSKMKKPIYNKVAFLPPEKPQKTCADLYDFVNYDIKDSEDSNISVSTVDSQNKVALGVTAANKLTSSLEKEASSTVTGIHLYKTNKMDTELNFTDINLNHLNEAQSNFQRKRLQILTSLPKSAAAEKPSSAKIRFPKSTTKKSANVTNEGQKIFSKINTFKGTKSNKTNSSKSSLSVRNRQNKNHKMPLAYKHETYNTKGLNDIPQRTNNGTLSHNSSSSVTKFISGKNKNMQSVELEDIKKQITEEENDRRTEYSDQFECEYNEEDAVLLFREDNYMSSENLYNLGVEERNFSEVFDDDSVNIYNGNCSENEIFDGQNNSGKPTISQDLYSEYSDTRSLCDTYRDRKESILPSASDNETVRNSPNIQTRSRAKKIKTPKFNKTDTCDSMDEENIVLKPTKLNSCAASFSSTTEFKRGKGGVDETIVLRGEVKKVPHVSDITRNSVSAAEKQKSKQSNVRNNQFQKKSIEHNYKAKNLPDVDWEEENSENFCSKMVSETTEILLRTIMKMQTNGSSPLNHVSPRSEEKNLPCLASPTSSKSQDELDSDVMPTKKANEPTCNLKSNIVIGKMFDDIQVPNNIDTQAKRRLLLSGKVKSNSNFQELFDEKEMFL